MRAERSCGASAFGRGEGAGSQALRRATRRARRPGARGRRPSPAPLLEELATGPELPPADASPGLCAPW